MHSIEKLLQIMARLRDPHEGCPWDLEQSYESLVPYTLEEAYEVAGAIGRGDSKELCEELGDLLFQVVFYAQIAQEKQHFSFDDVVGSIASKLVRRHPHVFADASVASAEEQTLAWERFKAQERKEKAGGAVDEHGVTDAHNVLEHSVLEHSALDGICEALPALIRAQKIQRRAAREGFDWTRVADVLAKIDEELEECREVISDEAGRSRREEEVGDLLFSCVNLARHLEVDAEGALRKANDKFSDRYRAIERKATQQGRKFSELTLEEMDLLWEQVKLAEK